MVIDTTDISYFVLAVVAYYLVLFGVSLRRPKVGTTLAAGDKPLIVVVVPARNEEAVIEETLDCLCRLDYSEYRVLVMNDGSRDRTSELAHEFEKRNPLVRVVDREPAIAGRGKSDVLNHAFQIISAEQGTRSRWLDGRPGEEILVGIVDADGRLEDHALAAVVPFFLDDSVGQVQIGVRIGNASSGVLARMQDMEFVGFSNLVQVARDRIGSSGLGGNGQFTRLAALQSLGALPWRPGALTEDLELGLSLVERGWSTRYTSSAYVYQQGLTHWRPLLRQRTRWIQGHYGSWRHIPALVRAKGVRGLGRIDLITYLLLVTTVVVISGELVLDWLGHFGIVTLQDSSLTFLPSGILGRLIDLAIAFAPLICFVITYQRCAKQPLRWWEVPTYSVMFTLYTYVWMIATLRAWVRIATRRTSWVKTPRVVVAPPGRAVV